MRRTLFSIGVAGIVATLPACSGEKQPDLTPEQQMNAIMQANSPFGAAEIRMNETMLKAVGVDAGDSWVRKMIEHHKGAVAIAQQTLSMNPDAHVAELARSTIRHDAHEVGTLQKLLVEGSPNRASADLYQEAEDKMHQAMMAAGGIGLSQTYHLKLIEQHRGAVLMADVALANVASGAVRKAAEDARSHHLKQLDLLQNMLSDPIER